MPTTSEIISQHMTAQLQAKEAECQVIKVLPCIHIYIVTTGIVNPYNLVVIVRLFFEIQHPLLQSDKILLIINWMVSSIK